MKISKKLVSAVLGINVKSIYVSCDIDDDNPAVSLDCGTYTRNINIHELAYETKLYVSKHNFVIQSSLTRASLYKSSPNDNDDSMEDRTPYCIGATYDTFEPLAILAMGKKAHKLITNLQE